MGLDGQLDIEGRPEREGMAAMALTDLLPLGFDFRTEIPFIVIHIML
jgi:hypothetical protein